MPNEESLDKKVDDQIKTVEKKGNGQVGNGTKTVVLVVILVIVAVGLAAALKFTIFERQGKGFRGRVKITRNVQPRMMGRARMGGFAQSGSTISGTISAINGDKLTVKTSNKDQIVDITDTTSIIKGGQIAAKGDLKQNDTVVAAGSSNSAGALVATLIRVQ